MPVLDLHQNTVPEESSTNFSKVSSAELPAEDEDDEYVPVKERRKRRIAEIREANQREREHALQRRAVSQPGGVDESEVNIPTATPDLASLRRNRKTLFLEHQRLKQETEIDEGEEEEREMKAVVAEEQRILEQVQRSIAAPLTSVKERAKGIVYDTPLTTMWKLPRKYAEMSSDAANELRELFFIDVSGEDIPPPIRHFSDMRLPRAILRGLEAKGIRQPTQIQMQGLPAVLQGRDLIGIAFTGSGKTVVFVLPMVLFALENELKAPFLPGEGPHCLVVCPSRELAVQTTQTVQFFAKAMADDGYPSLRIICMIGGTSMAEQSHALRRGVHIVVATPGRLNSTLESRRMSLAQCMLLTLDEADRMIDLGFEEEVRDTLDHMQHQRQTLLFSATMPRKIQEFARSALVRPVVVNVGRAGAANLDVIQEVEYVKQDDKLHYLVKCLQKTPPPVVVFCENKKTVDEVHEYLLLKTVEAVGIHGGLSQEERQEAIAGFRTGSKDVLIGTDVASKGLDFPAIQHVINFDMPKEIEDYVHRIGRTGRCGRTGIATTFINKNQEETVLLDLRALLIEANQKIPPFLEALEPAKSFHTSDIGGVRGCAFCGGLGHRIAQCPKLESQKHKQTGVHGKDYVTSGSRYGPSSGYGGDW